jgi:uncharacterized glyoxalase superfamily protein PhnB
MKFSDICFISPNVMRLCAFYEAVFGGNAEGNEIHATLAAGGLHFTFMAEKTEAFYYEYTSSVSNTILSFHVDDADQEYRRLLSLGAEILNEPTTHGWGARSFQCKDPDGNMLNFRSLPK